MCGIAGIYTYRNTAPRVDREELARISEAMFRRGPDGDGVWIAPHQRIGLAHRRLAIIDLSPMGIQPMGTADGRLQITFNGEIYNYRELRRDLEARGCIFRSHTDTEVLLHLYAQYGGAMVHRLRGMFAFGIWDETAQELFLARDHFGIKPLYYSDDGRSFRFATLVGSLIAGGKVDTGADIVGLAGFYLWGAVPEPRTLYQTIKSLPAGHTMRISAAGADRPVPFFDITEEFRKAEAAPATLSDADLRERIREVMQDSMRAHMVADVPVGLFLSAGIDSNVLATVGANIDRPGLRAVTLGFSEFRGTLNDEVQMAEQSAAALGIAQSTKWLAQDDFHDEWRNFFAAMDQASTDGVNTYLVARAARAAGLKMAISGLGGDELFGSYPSFRDVPRMQRITPHLPGAGRWVRRLSSPVVSRLTSPKYAGVLEYGSTLAGAYLLRRSLYMPWELHRLMGADRAGRAFEELDAVSELGKSIDGLRNPRCAVAALELTWYMRNQLLRDADWAGMFHGVEIRVPFVDPLVLRALAPLMAGTNPPTKAHLAHAATPPLSTALIERKKTGFVVPVREWLSHDFPDLPRGRGLRGWARLVGRMKGGNRYLAFLTDAYGGHGGIALHNRDLLQSICDMRDCSEVVGLPRLMPLPPEAMPGKLRYITAACGGKLRYLAQSARLLWADRSFDLVICGHINLAPLAWLAAYWLKVPVVLFIHGIDAWQPTGSRLVNHFVRKLPWVVAVSELTAGRFRTWCDARGQQVLVNPNSIHLDWYGPGPRNPALLKRYGLENRRVLMTLGRLVSAERYKGFDEVLDLLPSLAAVIPDVAYMIAGDGSDRERLEEKAAALGLKDRVVFTGRIAEAEKADHYRLADVYVMASRGEGFGFVLLEAMACGVPVIASKLDGGREAVLDGRLGAVVDPGNPEELKSAILNALTQPHGQIPPGLDYYSFDSFRKAVGTLVRQVLRRSSSYPLDGM